MAQAKPLILIADRFATEAWAKLETTAFLRVEKSLTPHLDQTDLSEVAGLIIRSRTKIDAALLKRAPKLQVVVTNTSGFDHIDLASTAAHGVAVMYCPDANVQSAAELTWNLVLSCTKKTLAAHTAVKNGDWQRDTLVGTELEGKTYSVMGFGRIGKKVTQFAHAFGMKTMAFDPYLDDEDFVRHGTRRVSYEELLMTSDIISMHVPLTNETRNMMNAGHFDYINRGVIVINTSRGSVVNEQDLAEAIKKGWVSAAGLDVFDKEPLGRESQLIKMPQVVLSPHIGANTEDAFRKGSLMGADKMIQFFHDGRTSDLLPPQAAWYTTDPFHPPY